MLRAGVSVSQADVQELIRLLRNAGSFDIAARLGSMDEVEADLLNLSSDDREVILLTLADADSGGLARLRAVLLKQRLWVKREGLRSRPITHATSRGRNAGRKNGRL
jgi:hypothetical protein